jgi:hypothetical protein
MIPPGWTTTLHGNGVTFHPTAGVSQAAIRITERLTPVATMKTILQPITELMAKVAHDMVVGPIEHLQTKDGEYAAMVAASGFGNVDGVPLDIATGVVWGDDFYDRIDAHYMGETGVLHPLMREFIAAHRLGLGRGRHRRFLYTPPPGWWPLPRGLLVEWFPPDYPKHRTTIIVNAAMPEKELPAAESAHSILYRKIIAFRKREHKPLDPVTSEHGVSGIVYNYQGSFEHPDHPENEMVGCVLRDETYIYIMRMETVSAHVDADKELFMTMVKSIQPIPRRITAETDVFVTWQD